jgi:hypothetical protein
VEQLWGVAIGPAVPVLEREPFFSKVFCNDPMTIESFQSDIEVLVARCQQAL